MGFLKSFSQALDNAAVHRIGDYGKLWTVLDLFHPEMAYSTINRDSLFVDNIGDLLKDPSAANFKTAIQRMINRLGDPFTTIREASQKNDSVLLPDRPLLRWLPDSVALLYFNEDFMSQSNSNAAITPLTKLMDSLKTAHGFVIDLRNEKAAEGYSSYYEAAFIKRLIGSLIEHSITTPATRSRIHYGHESQTFDMSQFYYQGWVESNGLVITAKPDVVRRPVCLLINRFNDNLADMIAGMQNAGVAQVVAHGVLKNFDPASNYKMTLADSVTVAVRVSEAVYPDGRKSFAPDVQASNNVTDDTLIHTAVRLLRGNSKRERVAVVSEPRLPVNAFVSGYDSLAYPAASLRLLGLMRYWTAINYFCPNKDKITKNWDSVLYEYVPLFLAARDSFEYNRTAARLITEIHDGHGWFDSKVFKPFAQKTAPVQLKFVEGKTIVCRVFNDTLKTAFSPGDEIISVNGTPVKKLRDSLAQFIGASNDASLQRDVTNVLLAGKEGTAVTIKWMHNGNAVERTVPRRPNNWEIAYRGQEGAVWKKLNPKLGYVDFGRLEVEQIDSMFTDFKNTNAIIIDDRSYPRGTVWTLVNYLTDGPVKTALGATMIADSPDPSASITKNEVWEIPVTPKWKYTGKLIILVNETTQSQAEYSCMVLQGASKNVTIIGSQTAGADGDVTGISLPGGITTAFSGHGIRYPDGRPTQGIGIVPDINIKPTIAGIKAGRDEVLERAVRFAKTGK